MRLGLGRLVGQLGWAAACGLGLPRHCLWVGSRAGLQPVGGAGLGRLCWWLAAGWCELPDSGKEDPLGAAPAEPGCLPTQCRRGKRPGLNATVNSMASIEYIYIYIVFFPSQACLWSSYKKERISVRVRREGGSPIT